MILKFDSACVLFTLILIFQNCHRASSSRYKINTNLAPKHFSHGHNNNNFQEFRLPKSVVPTHYSLQLQPILDETPGYTRFTAPGKITITVNCTEDTAVIKLHALDLDINDAATSVTNLETSQELAISGLGFDPENQFYIITLNESLKAGSRYDIFMEFVTPVSQTRLDGMYLDHYIDPVSNETKYVATTTFAAITARRCFPSFDEPQLKAVFSITLGRKEGYHSLSNMHQISTDPMPDIDGYVLDRFAPSLPMSTYLVAMIVSDMTYEEAPKEGESATFRVYAPYYLIDRGGGVYAANQTKTVLGQFENYFDSSFMLQKLDSVSLPRFFYSAMENWGLITYNDRVLLYFPGETTEQERYRITNIIAHEVVHHYFGNLVTCEWWTWIWLNEGAATYFSYLGVELTYPEFIPWERFITDVYQVAMAADDKPNPHPVANEPQSIADIGGIYDDIAYRKGATLLRMMESFLTEEVMQTSIRRYIQSRQFSTASQDNLFQHVQETVNEVGKTLPASVKDIMDTWTMQSGYPLIRVSRTGPREIRLTQERFQAPRNNADELWWIPITIAVTDPIPKQYFLWMPNDQKEVVFAIPEEETFILNPRSEEYYRVLYSPELLEDLLFAKNYSCEKSNVSKASATAKAKLIDDYFTFTKSGLIGKQEMDKILASDWLCLGDANLVVWQTIFHYYTNELLLAGEKQNFTLARKVKSSMEILNLPIARALTNLQPNQTLIGKGEVAMLSSELLFWGCFVDPRQALCSNNFVKAKMESWLMGGSGESPFPVDLEETFFCMAASMSDKYWERIYDYMMVRKSKSSQARILSALSCTSNPDLLNRISDKVRTNFFDLGVKRAKDIFKSHKHNHNSAEKIPLIRTAIRQLFKNHSG